MITAISLFDPIKARVVMFDFSFVYFKAIQHLFVSLGVIWVGVDDSFILSKKFC